MDDASYPPPGELLRRASDAVAEAVDREVTTPADRSYLTATAARLRAMAQALQEGHGKPVTVPAEPPLPKPPPRLVTRTEAARLAGVHPNTLLLWEQRDLLRPRRDQRGWRVYDRADLARAMQIASRHPVEPLEA